MSLVFHCSSLSLSIYISGLSVTFTIALVKSYGSFTFFTAGSSKHYWVVALIVFRSVNMHLLHEQKCESFDEDV